MRRVATRVWTRHFTERWSFSPLSEVLLRGEPLARQSAPVLDSMELEIVVESLQVLTFGVRFPSGVSQRPLDEEVELLIGPPVADNFIHHPFHVFWRSQIVRRQGFPVREQYRIVWLVSAEQTRVEGGMNASSREVGGQLQLVRG